MNIRIIERIGSGAFADIWRGHDEDLAREVAVKVIRSSMKAEEDVFSQGRALAAVHHPNVVTVHGVAQVKVPGQGRPEPGLVLELLDGETLEQRLRGQRFMATEVETVSSGIIDGLLALHAAGIVHGDLHTENVQITAVGVAMLLDPSPVAGRTLSTMSREGQIGQDARTLAEVLCRVAMHSEIDIDLILPFCDEVRHQSSVGGVKRALVKLGSQIVASKPTMRSKGLPPMVQHSRSAVVPPGTTMVLSGTTDNEEPIRALRIIEEEVTVPKMDGTRGSGLYKVPILLNRTPSASWARHFVDSWDHPTTYSSMHRQGIAKVRGNKVLLDGTTLEEIQKVHLATVKLAINMANQREMTEREQERKRADEEHRRQEAHREEARRLAKEIKFD